MTTNTEALDQRIEKNKADFDRIVEAVREDPDLNDQAKRREIGEAYERASRTHNELHGQKQALVQQRLDEARKKAFAPPYVPGADKAQAMTSYRDAIARTSGTRDVKELEVVLDQANLTGDEVLAKAVLYRSYQLQSELLIGRFLEGRPEARQTWDQFMSAAEEHNAFEAERKPFGGARGPERPEELGGWRSREISPETGQEANDGFRAAFEQVLGRGA